MLRDAVHMGDQVEADIRRGSTGREIPSAQADLVGEIKSWLCSDLAVWTNHPLSSKFLKEINTRELQQSSCSSLEAFRMQWVEGTPTCERMGAPEPGQTPAGRYNEKGCPALYLSLEYDGARREIKNFGASPREALWVQKYNLPLKKLSVVDVRVQGDVDWFGTVFDYCETAERANNSSSPYPCSRRIAALVRQAGYDCMLIPGVRGDRDGRYTNAVVFNFGSHRGCDWQMGNPEQVIFTVN